MSEWVTKSSTSAGGRGRGGGGGRRNQIPPPGSRRTRSGNPPIPAGVGTPSAVPGLTVEAQAAIQEFIQGSVQGSMQGILQTLAQAAPPQPAQEVSFVSVEPLSRANATTQATASQSMNETADEVAKKQTELSEGKIVSENAQIIKDLMKFGPKEFYGTTGVSGKAESALCHLRYTRGGKEMVYAGNQEESV